MCVFVCVCVYELTLVYTTHYILKITLKVYGVILHDYALKVNVTNCSM